MVHDKQSAFIQHGTGSLWNILSRNVVHKTILVAVRGTEDGVDPEDAESDGGQ